MTTRTDVGTQNRGWPLLAEPGAPSVHRRDPQLSEVKAPILVALGEGGVIAGR